MEVFFLALIKSSLSLVLFYAFYKTFLNRETFFKINRIVILLAIGISIVIPFLTISTDESPLHALNLERNHLDLITRIAVDKTALLDSSPSVLDILLGVYFAGVVIRFFLVCFGVSRIVKMINTSERIIKNSYILITTSYSTTPFSWWKYIVINKYENDNDADIIERHELLHLRHWHSLDLLFAEIATIVFWFHPVIHLFKSELKNNHEFEVDAALLKQGEDAATYQLLLLKRAAPGNFLPGINTFSQPQISLRIKMMLRSKSNNLAGLKYVGLIIVGFTAVMAFAKPLYNNRDAASNIESRHKDSSAPMELVDTESGKIAIRKTSPVNTNLPALYIIDGKKSGYDDFTKIAAPNLKKITLLKGKDATTVYGQEASGGVVIVETK